MKTISDYRSETLILLGDTAGRRYSETILDTAVRQALDLLRKYLPDKETEAVTAAAREGQEIVLNWCPASTAEILTIRNAGGTVLTAADYRTGARTYLQFYNTPSVPEVGDTLTIELGQPHRIKDLDGSETTTVPEDLMLTVCTGAAGYALQIRARSVTEVFGKRPEDTERLLSESSHLETQFIAALDFAAFAASVHRDPWPGPGFPI